MLTQFELKVVEIERKKLRAIQDKLPQAIKDKNIARVIGLAQAAERVAARLAVLLDNVNKRGH